MHSEGILSGELKHGPLALIDDTMPVMMIVVKDHTYEKCLNAVQQVTARNVSPKQSRKVTKIKPLLGQASIYLRRESDQRLEPIRQQDPLHSPNCRLSQGNSHNHPASTHVLSFSYTQRPQRKPTSSQKMRN